MSVMSVIILSLIKMSVIVLSFIILNVIMLSGIILNVIGLSVMAPQEPFQDILGPTTTSRVLSYKTWAPPQLIIAHKLVCLSL